jgi:hypothetical protein
MDQSTSLTGQLFDSFFLFLCVFSFFLLSVDFLFLSSAAQPVVVIFYLLPSFLFSVLLLVAPPVFSLLFGDSLPSVQSRRHGWGVVRHRGWCGVA